MIIYEVNLAVDNEIAEAFAAWLQQHIPEVLDAPGFVDAVWYYREAESVRQLWTVHYRITDWKSLQQYFDDRAAEMRKKGLDRFGGRFEADRRVLVEGEIFRKVSDTL